ncbi:MAG: universal stress protein [Hyphomicrobiaceae bacterium]
MKRILMANDMSARSDRALRRAVALAKEFDAELEVLTVIEEMFLEATTRSNLAFAENALAEQISGVPDANDVNITKRAVVGLDYEDIIERAEELDVDLLVLGIHRHKRRELFQGTTAERLVRHSTRPLLVVRDPVTSPYRRILVASDLSSQAEAATRTAARLAPVGKVVVLHAVNPHFQAILGRRDQKSFIDQQRARAADALEGLVGKISTELGDAAPKFELSFPEGKVYAAILAEVASLKPDLLAIGTHGRSGIARAVIGSIAEQLLADSPIDILTVQVG